MEIDIASISSVLLGSLLKVRNKLIFIFIQKGTVHVRVGTSFVIVDEVNMSELHSTISGILTYGYMNFVNIISRHILLTHIVQNKLAKQCIII
jgi:hypothetical protein